MLKVKNYIDIENRLRTFFKGEIRLNEPLAGYSWLKIGGTAKLFLVPCDIDDLSRLSFFLNSISMPFYVLGAGSNLLISDNYLPRAIIKLESSFFKRIICQGTNVFAAAGVLLPSLLNFTKQARLSGLEFLIGVPGTIGGALVMNAGTRDVAAKQKDKFLSISEWVEKVQVMDKCGKMSVLDKKSLKFGYRYSDLHGYLVLGAWFKLNCTEEKEIECRFNKFLEYKKSCQELNSPSAGCIFKNPEQSSYSAGWLIDHCQLKGKTIGDAQISTMHANFIVNNGRATYQQVRELMDLMQREVHKRFKIRLEPEIDIWETKEL